MPTEWIWVLIVIVIIFGASRLPLMGRNVGLGIKEFKKGISEASRDEEKDASEAKRASGGEDGGTST